MHMGIFNAKIMRLDQHLILIIGVLMANKESILKKQGVSVLNGFTW